MRHAILAAILLAHSMPASAAAWQVDGYYQFWMEIEEVAFAATTRLEYSGLLTEERIAERPDLLFLQADDIIGLNRFNDGPWTPTEGAPVITLLAFYGCEGPTCSMDPDYLLPTGAFIVGGPFEWFRVTGHGTNAWFSHAGVPYRCDWDEGCHGGDALYPFTYWWETVATASPVPEPPFYVLLGAGLFWLVALRSRGA